MTEEGIVQETFKKYYSTKFDIHYKILMELQQELIEKIKQEFDNTLFVLHADYAKTIEKKLIGDTK